MSIRWIRYSTIALIFAAPVFAGLLWSEDPNIRDNPGGTDVAVNDGAGPDRITLDNYNPIAIDDPRIDIEDLTVDRRYAPDGRGEILDVMFTVHNLTNDPIELYAWVLAYRETNAVDEKDRRWVPYPMWRVQDPAKRDFVIHFMKITPKDIPPEKIWAPKANPDDKDGPYEQQKEIVDRMRDSVAAVRPVADLLPPAWMYIAYISRYPTQGLNFTLYGDATPPPDQLTLSDYVPPTPEEKRTKVFKNYDKHTYTIEQLRRKSIFRSHHYIRYKVDYEFYNTIAVVLFDAKAAKEYEQQVDAGNVAKEDIVNPMLFYQIYKIDHSLKIR
ncbi:MAG: hypothetical protein KDK23_14570 [Leptospiraceae bacterium]|nr:hypothetical protein [Leptospiraceae bacterium]